MPQRTKAHPCAIDIADVVIRAAQCMTQRKGRITFVKFADSGARVTQKRGFNQCEMGRFPAPVGPIIKVCPTSSACRLKRNGVWPLVFASSNGGLLGGYKGHGLDASPGQTAVVGSRCARFSVCRIGRRTFS